MISCKKHIIAACFSLILPVTAAWSEALVVDDSDNFAMMEEQAYQAPVTQRSKYDNNDFQIDDESALVKEDSNAPSYSEPSSDFNDNAKLIDKIQVLQRELQELRGQLEVQAHDLKLLQQQQVAFYKDLDARIGGSSGKLVQTKPALDITAAPKALVSQPSVSRPPAKTATKVAVVNKPIVPVSRINPADEQISYFAAYELVKNKKYDQALNSMQTFVQNYPRGGYTANAEYWLGEIYLLKKDYAKSIDHFEVVLDQFPSSGKSADSMLKVGYAYAASGNKPAAKKRFQNVVKTYPNTPTAQLAQLKLETLNAL